MRVVVLIVVATSVLAGVLVLRGRHAVVPLAPNPVREPTARQATAPATPTEPPPVYERRIQPGDMLHITLTNLFGKQETTPVRAVVADDGSIKIPAALHIKVAGLNPDEAARAIVVAGLRHNYGVTAEVSIAPQPE